MRRTLKSNTWCYFNHGAILSCIKVIYWLLLVLLSICTTNAFSSTFKERFWCFLELSKLGVAENWVMISPLLHFYLPCLISCPSSREEQEGFVLKRWIRHEREESVGSILGWPIKSSRRVIFFVLWISENLTVCGKMRGWEKRFRFLKSSSKLDHWWLQKCWASIKLNHASLSFKVFPTNMIVYL